MNPAAKYLLALLLTLVTPIALAYLYHAIPLATWLAAAFVNSLLAMVLLAYYRRSLLQQLHWRVSWRFYLPTIAVLIFCVLAIYLASFYGNPVRGRVAVYHYLWLSWIPIVEEIVFRLGMGTCLRKLAGNFWGTYCSALCFAFAHTLPTWERLGVGAVGVPVGVLLLGIACEWLFVQSRSLIPSIVLHSACNATVPLFTYFDQRWFSWLGILFQTSSATS